MTRYYLSLPYVILARRQQIHPSFWTKYNPLQRLAYFAVAVAGFLAVATGWAIHKPAIEQTVSELVFRLSDQHAQSRHGNEERLRSASETVVPGNKLKSPELPGGKFHC